MIAGYRSRTYDGRAVTGLDGAEIADTLEGGTTFYRTPRGISTLIPQDRTPRRARMRAGTVDHVDRWGNSTRFRVVEILRAESVCGPRPTIYGWRAADAVEVLA